MKKRIEIGVEARKKIIDGVNLVADTVCTTLGPNGRNVIFKNEYGEISSTKDGVTVAKQISNLENPIENLGAEMIKQVSIKTATKAGDGTTTSTLLTQHIINEGLEYINKGANAVEIKKGIDLAVKEVLEHLKNNITKPITSETQLEQIASISANNDPEIGKLISTALEKVGREGIVYIEESKSGETYLETVEGVQFERGYKSPYFVTDNNSMSCTLEDPYVLIVDKKITKTDELLNILNYISTQSKSLLIIAEDIEGEALSLLIVNKMRGSIKAAAVKAPDFGDRRKLLLEDIAIMTGGQVVSPEKGFKLDKFNVDWFGKARTVTITKDQTTIIDGKGLEESIEKRIEELQSQIEKSVVPFEKEKLQERLAKFIGGVSIIHVGGNSEVEMKEKKDRVDDALQATKAAIEEGIVPGGGAALIYAREAINRGSNDDLSIGKKIVYKACSAPFIKILTNAGYSKEDAYMLLNNFSTPNFNNWFGYNLKTESFVNMEDAGIIDPTKVTRNALENSASVAGTLLLTEAVIVDIEEKTKQDNGMLEGMM